VEYLYRAGEADGFIRIAGRAGLDVRLVSVCRARPDACAVGRVPVQRVMETTRCLPWGDRTAPKPGIPTALLRRQGAPLQSCSAWWIGVTQSAGALEGVSDWETGCGGAAEDQRRRAVDQERRKTEMGEGPRLPTLILKRTRCASMTILRASATVPRPGRVTLQADIGRSRSPVPGGHARDQTDTVLPPIVFDDPCSNPPLLWVGTNILSALPAADFEPAKAPKRPSAPKPQREGLSMAGRQAARRGRLDGSGHGHRDTGRWSRRCRLLAAPPRSRVIGWRARSQHITGPPPVTGSPRSEGRSSAHRNQGDPDVRPAAWAP